MHTSRFLFVLILLSAFIACKDAEETTAPRTETIQPTLSSIQEHIFTPSCAQASCHGSSASGGLNLTAGSSHSQLVNVRSNNDGAHSPTFYRVLPGKPDSSFLHIKITSPNGMQGDRMPQSASALSSEKIEAIRQWIANGAAND